MSTALDKLNSIVSIVQATYPIKTSANNSSILYTDADQTLYITGLMKSADPLDGETGLLALTIDNDVWPLPNNEPLYNKLLARIRSNATMLGKRYKPTMSVSAQRCWLMNNHYAEYKEAFKEEEEVLDKEYPYQCICGQIASGLHTSHCSKWQTAVNKRVTKRLKHLLPVLNPIVIPEDSES